MRSKRIGFAILFTVAFLFLAAGLVLAHGVLLWDPDGVPLCTAEGTQYEQDIVSYNNNGAVVVWTDGRKGGTPVDLDIYTQYVQSDGVRPWEYTVGATQGVSVCTASGNQYSPVLCESGGNLFYAWVDERGVDSDIYAQRVNSDGSIGWPQNGYPVCPLSGDQSNPRIVQDDDGGAIIAWEGWQAGAGNVDLFAQRLDGNGGPQWWPYDTGITVCDVISDQVNHAMIPDGAGGAIIVWEDHRNGADNVDIYAQRIDNMGTRSWASTGAAICTAPGRQLAPQVASDGDQGAIIVWHDGRDEATTGMDIYAQRVYSNGVVAWVVNGLPVCDVDGTQQDPRMIAVGDEHVITWQDFRSGGGEKDLYAQRIDGSGASLWTTDGISVCTAVGIQAWPTLALEDMIVPSAVIISWQDDRSFIPEEFDVYAQRVESDGTIDWPVNGIPVCTHAGTQEAPVSTADAHGGVIVVWQDNRARVAPDVYGIFGQRIRDFDYRTFLPLAYRQFSP